MSPEADTITDEQVAAVAQRLTDEGREVTPVTVWSELRRGSIVAAAAALQRWRDTQQPAQPAAHAPGALPDEFADALLSVARRLWSASQDDTHRVFGARLDAASQRLGAALSERDEALAAFQQTDEHVTHARAQLDTKAGALQVAEESSLRLQGELDAAKSRVTEAETRFAEMTQRVSADHAELDAARASLAEQRSAREALDATLAAKDTEIAQAAQERDDARKELASLNETLRGKTEEAERHASEHAARVASLESELEAAHKTISTEREANTAHAGEASVQRDELARVTSELDAARAHIATLNEEKALTAAELDAARNAVAAHGDQTSAQREEMARVQRELDDARAQIEALREAKTAAGADLERATQEASAARERAEAAERQTAQLETDLAASREAERNQQLELHAATTARESEVAELQRQISAQAKTHSKAYDELRGNAEQWVTYAKDLKHRLEVANEKLIFIDARSTGEVALMRRLSVELERLKPDHELIQREAQQKVIGDKMSQQLAQKGYRYDPATAVMSKLEV